MKLRIEQLGNQLSQLSYTVIRLRSIIFLVPFPNRIRLQAPKVPWQSIWVISFVSSWETCSYVGR